MVHMTRGPVLTYQPGPIINIWYLTIELLAWHNHFMDIHQVSNRSYLIVSDILNLSDFVLTCEVAILYLHNLMSPSGEKDGFVNEIFYSKNSESNLLFIAWFVIAHTLAYEVKKNHL